MGDGRRATGATRDGRATGDDAAAERLASMCDVPRAAASMGRPRAWACWRAVAVPVRSLGAARHGQACCPLMILQGAARGGSDCARRRGACAQTDERIAAS